MESRELRKPVNLRTQWTRRSTSWAAARQLFTLQRSPEVQRLGYTPADPLLVEVVLRFRPISCGRGDFPAPDIIDSSPFSPPVCASCGLSSSWQRPSALALSSNRSYDLRIASLVACFILTTTINSLAGAHQELMWPENIRCAHPEANHAPGRCPPSDHDRLAVIWNTRHKDRRHVTTSGPFSRAPANQTYGFRYPKAPAVQVS